MPTAEIEAAVLAQVQRLLTTPEMIVRTWTAAKDELNEDLLDNVHLAGARFDRMLKRLAG